jgi:hypothetical protein
MSSRPTGSHAVRLSAARDGNGIRRSQRCPLSLDPPVDWGVPTRITTSGRRPTLHLPRDWRWENGRHQLFDTVTTKAPTPAGA